MTRESSPGAQRDIERRMILRNQQHIMTALLAIIGTDHKAAGDLFYSIAKIQGYMGNDTSRSG